MLLRACTVIRVLDSDEPSTTYPNLPSFRVSSIEQDCIPCLSRPKRVCQIKLGNSRASKRVLYFKSCDKVCCLSSCQSHRPGCVKTHYVDRYFCIKCAHESLIKETRSRETDREKELISQQYGSTRKLSLGDAYNSKDADSRVVVLSSVIGDHGFASFSSRATKRMQV